MFRASRRPREDAPVAVPQQTDTTQKKSGWRPALRRIKKRLFSKPATPENVELVKPQGTYSAPGRPLEIHQQRLKERNARPSTAQDGQIPQDQHGFQHSNVLRKHYLPIGLRETKEPSTFNLVKPQGTQSTPNRPLLEIHQQRLNERNARPSTAPYGQRPQEQSDFQNSNVLRKHYVPMGPREPKEPSTFNLVKRSLSRRNSKRNSTHEAREPIFLMRDIQKEEVEIISAGPPTMATYIPRHAASDFQKQSSNQQQTTAIPARRPATASTMPPKVAAYEPKHAASDFSKLNLPFSLDSNGLAHPPSRAAADPTNRHSFISTIGTDTEIDDYQIFMKASRLAAAGNYNSHGVISAKNFTPKTSQLMQDIISDRRLIEKERAYALSQLSTASRPVSRSGSIFEKVADYVKPNRTGSVRTQRTQRTGFTSVDGGSVKDMGLLRVSEGRTLGARRNNRWSWAGESIRRSFSRERDRGAYEGFDEEEEEDHFEGERGRKRRSRVMPVAPGLRRYNQGVRYAGY
ncbi:hypothetical protein VTL71DRAFT_13825 [Oculimacula yallundae]|uniref:Uncharacterized protein n=1 Tax=Oculimacula yallundae TaxID=86028 RepID=A0ABR4CM13_9HELO